MAVGAETRTRTIEEHLPLVRAVARRYAGRGGEPLEDLVQVGTIGLIKAVDRFDPARDRDLAALARPCIEGEIRHHLRDRAAPVRVPAGERELATRLRTAADELEARTRRTPTVAELARVTGVDEARAARALEATGPGAAQPLRDASGRPDDEAAEARILLAQGWTGLGDRERRLLELRYCEDRTQGEIAAEVGLSQAHVSRLLRAALEQLRAGVAGAPPREPRDARSGRLLLRLPPDLHTRLAAQADRDGVSLNAYLVDVLGRSAQPARGLRTRLLLAYAILVALATLVGVALVALALVA